MRSRFSHTLLAMPLALALGCAGTAPIMAQDEGPTQLQRMLGNFGLLAIPGDTPDIEYRERPPLVVPPSTELPLPQSPTDITAAVPDWPADPEIARQREQKRYDQLPIDQRRGDFHTGRGLTPAEIRRGTIARTGTRTPNTKVGEEITAGREMQAAPKGLFGMFKYEAEKPVAFAGEPPRTRLTEPPPGYQTPSPNAPYGVVEKDKPSTAPRNVMDKQLADGDKAKPQ
jgi:hypothetical protein